MREEKRRNKEVYCKTCEGLLFFIKNGKLVKTNHNKKSCKENSKNLY